MLQKFKIMSCAFIVALVLVLPSQAVAQNATSCKGWQCNIPGQVCPQGVPGASGADFVCGEDNKWRKIEVFDVQRVPAADQCKGWECNLEGQVCPPGAPGAGNDAYICSMSKWMELDAGGCAVAGLTPRLSQNVVQWGLCKETRTGIGDRWRGKGNGMWLRCVTVTNGSCDIWCEVKDIYSSFNRMIQGCDLYFSQEQSTATDAATTRCPNNMMNRGKTCK